MSTPVSLHRESHTTFGCIEYYILRYTMLAGEVSNIAKFIRLGFENSTPEGSGEVDSTWYGLSREVEWLETIPPICPRCFGWPRRL